MASEWRAVALLPNLKLRYSLEAAAIAIVPTSDRRVKALRNRNGALRTLLNRFKDGFGYKLEPSVLLVNEKAPNATAGSAAVVSFRDIIAFCGSLPGQARLATNKSAVGVVPQETFAFFPWTYPAEKDHPDALRRICQLHVVPDFHGRPTPGPFPVEFDYKENLDAQMLAALGKRWREHFERQSTRIENEALFRALSLAGEAALITTLPFIDISRVGKILTLWCSAFELLLSRDPDRTPNGAAIEVVKLLNSVCWVMPESDEKIAGGTTAAAHLYNRLAQCRDDYTMCLPVDTRVLPGSNRSVLEFVSPLFRLALTAYLDMNPPNEPEGSPAEDAFARSLAGRIAYVEAQRACEEAVLQPWNGKSLTARARTR